MLFMAFMGLGNGYAQSAWDFTSLGSSDQSNMGQDDNWKKDSSKDRWSYTAAQTEAPLMANGAELTITQGLLFTTTADASNGSVRFGLGSDARMWANGTKVTITLPNLKKGQEVTVEFATSSSGNARGITATNLRDMEGFEKTAARTRAIGIVEADGKVTLTPNGGGIYIYNLSVTGVPTSIQGNTTDTYQDAYSHNVGQDFNARQMQVSLDNSNILYYNTDDLSRVDVDKEKSTVTVSTKQNEQDVFYGSVRNISFSKPLAEIPEGVVTDNGIEITEARGWYETAYVKWNLVEGAESYHVYVKGGRYVDYTKIDEQLVRNYGTYGRADVVGLVSGSYSMKVIAVDSEGAEMSASGEATDMEVINYQRDGFAFLNHAEGVGAYNHDGSLKSGARVLYVTPNTAKTVTCDVITSSSGATTTSVGLQTILDNYLKGYDSTPIAFRFIGTIDLSDLDHISSSAEGLQVKSNKDNELNMTFEGIGDDATIKNFGFLLHGARSVELRNFAVMMFMDDAISIDTDNKNVWVHHIDIFYGQPGSDLQPFLGCRQVVALRNDQGERSQLYQLRPQLVRPQRLAPSACARDERACVEQLFRRQLQIWCGRHYGQQRVCGGQLLPQLQVPDAYLHAGQ